MAQKNQATLSDIFSDDDFFAGTTTASTPASAEVTVENQAVSETRQKHVIPTAVDQVAIIAAQKLTQIEKELNAHFMERENEIRSLIIGIIAARHVLLLGPPGTGKSFLAESFAKHVQNSHFFQYLFSATTDPSEILGPFSLKELEKGNFIRNFTGKLPEAEIAFLDEIYKGNSAALNILLPILNEGIWYNDGKPQKAALQFAVAASNEEPQEEGLAAFHDRFPFRHWVDYVRDNGNKAVMLKNHISGRKYQPQTFITLDEIETLRKKAEMVTADDSVIQQFQSLIFELGKNGIVISDRRQNICLELAQAHAVLEGRTQIVSDDFIVLTPVLWQRKDDMQKVESEVLKLANPFEEKLKRHLMQAIQIYDQTIAIELKADRAAKAVDARNTLTKIDKDLDKLLKDAQRQGRDTTKIAKAKSDVDHMNKEIVRVCLMMDTEDESSGDGIMPF